MTSKQNPDALDLLRVRRNHLARTDADCYVNQKEVNTVWMMEEEIKRGREAERRAADYFDFLKTLKEGEYWDWVTFVDFHHKRENERAGEPED